MTVERGGMFVLTRCYLLSIVLYLCCNTVTGRIRTGAPYNRPLPSMELLNNDKYRASYGSEWMLFPDGDGNLHFVNLTFIPPETRSVDLDEIEFRLYTRDNVNNFSILDEEHAIPLENSNTISFNNISLKIITHGWRSSATKSDTIQMKDEYLKRGDTAVITVDWSETADSLIYPVVASNTKSVGIRVANFLKALSDRYQITGDQIHLIGHSLGAHVMGNAAANSVLDISRITGLDPARPFFEFPSRPSSEKLDASDAKFVDIIHTSSGIFGVEDSIGTIDFYPNNGRAPQPGCEILLYIFDSCSHGKSKDYFTTTINNPKAFKSYKCKSWTDFSKQLCDEQSVYMGDEVDQTAKGNYYLKTTN